MELSTGGSMVALFHLVAVTTGNQANKVVLIIIRLS
jgi:hypothetical protein